MADVRAWMLPRGRYHTLGGCCRLFGDEGRGRRLYKGLGSGSRCQRHHGKYGAAWSDRYGHGSKGRPGGRHAQGWNRAWTLGKT